jgi:hypothetical protein
VRPEPADETLCGQGGIGAEGAGLQPAEQGAKDGVAVEGGRAEPVDAAVVRDQVSVTVEN